MKFIQVTRIHWGAQAAIAINTAHIIAVKPTARDDDPPESAQSVVYLGGAVEEIDKFFVCEAFDQILAAIKS